MDSSCLCAFGHAVNSAFSPFPTVPSFTCLGAPGPQDPAQEGRPLGSLHDAPLPSQLFPAQLNVSLVGSQNSFFSHSLNEMMHLFLYPHKPERGRDQFMFY